MAKKFYAVRNGNKIGIFTDWDECKASVDGYPGAEYKGFGSREKAVRYMHGENPEETQEVIRPTPSEGEAIAYVDGSFNAQTNEYAYGAVLFIGDERLEFAGKDNKENAVAMRNVAGELKGAMFVMQYCIKQGIKKLTIHHDYEGIAKWYTGEWKANTVGTRLYKEFCAKAKSVLKIQFVKVKGHSGDAYNDLADALAKSALGIE